VHLVRRLLAIVTAVVALAAGGPASAASFTHSDLTLRMSDGVQLAATLYEPVGAAPPAGWPAIVMFHALGGIRADMNVLAEAFFANQGYAVLTFDARGHGASGGLWGLDGPRENADARTLFDWLAARGEVDAKHIGAYGISLGGGEVWNSTAIAHVPWAAIVPEATWTDLYSALFPQNLSKSGLILQLSQLVPDSRTDPEILVRKGDAVQSSNLASLHQLTDSRSVKGLLGSVTTPTLMIQGRRDFLFDIDQALAAYRALRGPKRLYLTDLGHAPSNFLTPDLVPAEHEATQWFDRFLKGMPNGIDTGSSIALAKDPYTGSVKYAAVPTTRRLAFRVGARTIGGAGKIMQTFTLPRRALETFGAPVVTLSLGRSTFSHLIAVVSSIGPDGRETLISDGGVPLRIGTRKVAIRLLDQAVHIPPGSKLRLTLAGSSTAQSGGNLLYLATVSPTSTLRVRGGTVSLSVLKQAISG
jgi:ABC-2 type transport system ATP-binding protein